MSDVLARVAGIAPALADTPPPAGGGIDAFLALSARPSQKEDGVIELWFAHHRVARLDLKTPKP
ncbi:hypothetical protein PPMP20_23050 [Paraburkholderia phymatum]|uniref:hypothetical protein n=1 Tax=Paraburkholderia phymatum TaxID=148447 RepID=UPI0005A274C5|nr:hypothetical protein [Paraburkholderia phymatum]